MHGVVAIVVAFIVWRCGGISVKVAKASGKTWFKPSVALMFSLQGFLIKHAARYWVVGSAKANASIEHCDYGQTITASFLLLLLLFLLPLHAE